jgi:hypothetical protein
LNVYCVKIFIRHCVIWAIIITILIIIITANYFLLPLYWVCVCLLCLLLLIWNRAFEGMDWVQLAPVRDRWRALGDALMNFRVTWKAESILYTWGTVRFWNKIELISEMCHLIYLWLSKQTLLALTLTLLAVSFLWDGGGGQIYKLWQRWSCCYCVLLMQPSRFKLMKMEPFIWRLWTCAPSHNLHFHSTLISEASNEIMFCLALLIKCLSLLPCFSLSREWSWSACRVSDAARVAVQRAVWSQAEALRSASSAAFADMYKHYRQVITPQLVSGVFEGPHFSARNSRYAASFCSSFVRGFCPLLLTELLFVACSY